MRLAAVSILVLAVAGCGAAPSIDSIIDARCVEAWGDPAFAAADSSFILDPGGAGAAYGALHVRYPYCALLESRIGDARLITGDTRAAYDHYDAAIRSDQCEVAAILGRTLLELVGGTAASRRESILTQLAAEGTCTGGEVLRHVAWRTRAISGLPDRASLDLRSLALGKVYDTAALNYGQELLDTVPEGGIFITSSPVEADLALLVEPGSWRPRDRLVIDATLLEYREYVKMLVGLGLPLSISADDVERLVPYWDDDAGRHISVREQVLRDLVGTPAGAITRPPIALSRSLRDVWLMRQSTRLTPLGLVLALDVPPGRVDLARRVAVVKGYRAYGLAAFEPTRFPGGSAYLTADVYMLLSRYLEVAHEVGLAAARVGEREMAHDVAMKGIRWAKALGRLEFIDTFQDLVAAPES